MCFPLPVALAVASAAASAAGSAANYAQQSAQADAMNETNQAVAARNQKLAHASSSLQYQSLDERIEQERTKAAFEGSRIARESVQARSRVTAAAVEAGVKGGSVDALLADFERQEGEYLTAVKLNESMQEAQISREKAGVRLGLEGRLISSTPGLVARPSLLAASLSAFGSAVSSGVQVGSAAHQAELKW